MTCTSNDTDLDAIFGIVYNTIMPDTLIVLDTNILIAALRSKRGAAYQLLTLVGTGRFEVVLSVALVLEYEDVITRFPSELALTKQDVDNILDYLCATGKRQRIYYL